MAEKIVFDDMLTTAALAAGAVSQTLGPGRLARCREIAIVVQFGTTCLNGSADVEASGHQDFPGVPEVVDSVGAPGVGGETRTRHIHTPYAFLRVKANGVDGNGIESVRAIGN